MRARSARGSPPWVLPSPARRLAAGPGPTRSWGDSPGGAAPFLGPDLLEPAAKIVVGGGPLHPRSRVLGREDPARECRGSRRCSPERDAERPGAPGLCVDVMPGVVDQASNPSAAPADHARRRCQRPRGWANHACGRRPWRSHLAPRRMLRADRRETRAAQNDGRPARCATWPYGPAADGDRSLADFSATQRLEMAIGSSAPALHAGRGTRRQGAATPGSSRGRSGSHDTSLDPAFSRRYAASAASPSLPSTRPEALRLESQSPQRPCRPEIVERRRATRRRRLPWS